MSIMDSPVVISFIVGYLLICIAIGVWSVRRTRTSADFFVVGRRLGPFVIVIAMNATALTGIAFVGGPGIVADSGTTSMWLLAGYLGPVIAVLLVGKRLRLMAETREILSLPDAVAARYGGVWPRAAMATALLFGVVCQTGTGILALGMALVAVFGVKLPVAILIGFGVLGFYSVAGGMVAAIYTNLFQGAIITVTSVAIFYYALKAGGGMSEISTTLWAMDPEFAGPWGAMGPTAAISWYLISAVGFAGQPQVISKFLMARDVRSLKWVAVLSILAIGPLVLIWPTVGVAMRALIQTGMEQPLASPDLAMPTFLLGHTPAWLIGLALAGLLSASMSTADSFLNVGAAAAVRDLPIAITGRPLRRELWWSRFATGGLLVFATLFALYMEGLTAILGAFTQAMFAAAIVPSVAIGFNWKRANATACVSSILLSLTMNLGLELLDRGGIYTPPHGIFSGAVAILTSIIVFVVVSFATSNSKKEILSPDIKAAMEV